MTDDHFSCGCPRYADRSAPLQATHYVNEIHLPCFKCFHAFVSFFSGSLRYHYTKVQFSVNVTASSTTILWDVNVNPFHNNGIRCEIHSLSQQWNQVRMSACSTTMVSDVNATACSTTMVTYRCSCLVQLTNQVAVFCNLLYSSWPLAQWYSTGGTRRHLRGYVKFKISIYILFPEWSELHYFGFNLF
jgi:hypothetical protein